jgi:hypothetical protein
MGQSGGRMAFREELQKRLEKKRAEIVTLEGKLREATVYAQALQDTLRLLPEDESVQSDDTAPSAALREGSNIAKAREAIQRAGRPLHIMELLKAIGRPTDKENRAALSGSIGAYVRKGEFFTRPGPNVFGLIGMQNGSVTQPGPFALPPNFGIDEPVLDVDPEEKEGI